jgi:hypothetical protein
MTLELSVKPKAAAEMDFKQVDYDITIHTKIYDYNKPVRLRLPERLR